MPALANGNGKSQPLLEWDYYSHFSHWRCESSERLEGVWPTSWFREAEAAKPGGLLTPGVLCPFDFVNELSTAVDVNGEVVREGRGRWALVLILLPNICQD